MKIIYHGVRPARVGIVAMGVALAAAAIAGCGGGGSSVTLTGTGGGGGSGGAAPQIVHFTAYPGHTLQVDFGWSVTGGGGSGQIRMELDFGDGSQAVKDGGPGSYYTTRIYPRAGFFTAVLTATDKVTGGSASKSIEVTVPGLPDLPPVSPPSYLPPVSPPSYLPPVSPPSGWIY
jgi:hypothetical protein